MPAGSRCGHLSPGRIEMAPARYRPRLSRTRRVMSWLYCEPKSSTTTVLGWVGSVAFSMGRWSRWSRCRLVEIKEDRLREIVTGDWQHVAGSVIAGWVWLCPGWTQFLFAMRRNSPRTITDHAIGPRKESWVTAGSRAVSTEALPRSCIAIPSSTTLQWEYLGRGQKCPSADVPLDVIIAHMFLSCQAARRLRSVRTECST